MLVELSKEEFNDFALNHPCSSFFENSYWGDLKKEYGWNYYLVGLKKDGQIKGASLLLAKKIPIFNKYFYYAPRGYLLDYSSKEDIKEFSDGVIEFVKKHHGIFVKISPYVEYQQRDVDGNIVSDGRNNKELVDYLISLGYQHVGFTIHYGKDLEPRWLSVLDIENKSEEEIFKAFRSTYRRKIKHSLDGCLKLESMEENPEDFEKIMMHTGQRRGFIVRPISYYESMCKHLKDYVKCVVITLDIDLKIENLKKDLAKAQDDRKEAINDNINQLLEAKKIHGNKLPLTAGVFMCFGKEVVYLYGGSYDIYMKYLGPYFMQWEMIKYAINNGYKRYNFYGIEGVFTKDFEGYGLFDFKRGFNAYIEELVGEFNYITDPFFDKVYDLMYEVYKLTKKIKK